MNSDANQVPNLSYEMVVSVLYILYFKGHISVMCASVGLLFFLKLRAVTKNIWESVQISLIYICDVYGFGWIHEIFFFP
jgi:uncharacterized membrane protein YwaF